MIMSKLTSKAQTTIPQPVRHALNLHPGDEVGYQIEDDRVVLFKAVAEPAQDDPFATFGEWATDADQRAYGTL
jgi:antitoxin PrlF